MCLPGIRHATWLRRREHRYSAGRLRLPRAVGFTLPRFGQLQLPVMVGFSRPAFAPNFSWGSQTALILPFPDTRAGPTFRARPASPPQGMANFTFQVWSASADRHLPPTSVGGLRPPWSFVFPTGEPASAGLLDPWMRVHLQPALEPPRSAVPALVGGGPACDAHTQTTQGTVTCQANPQMATVQRALHMLKPGG
jgi:hypothetical protein